MRFEEAPKKDVWRGRGRPRREVPDQVKDMADSTYRTGNVGVVHVEADEEEELRELVGYLNSYAGSLGRRMRVQREDDTVRFEMVDIKPRKKAAA
jgi:hypothetical protein